MSVPTAANPSSAANTKASLTLDSNSKQDIRRRAVAVTKKKSTTEMLVGGGINGVSNDKMTVGEKDLSHTMRGESVLERPKDLLEAKRGLVSPGIASRHKKGISRQRKPKWQLLLGILMKTCLLLGALLWLGLLLLKWYDMLAYNRDSSFAALDYEGRLSEVEASLKKTAKMLQVQVEVVDRKIGSEAGTVTRDLKNQIEEKHALLEKELKRLEHRTDILDKSLRELRDTGFLSMEEFDDFLNELNKRSSDGSNQDLTLDDIMNVAKEIVAKEIEKHAADGLGRVDYALASGGARVVRHSEPYVLGKSSNWLAIGKGRNGAHPNSQKMLEPSFGEPGQCFALQGSSGFVEIRLRTGIIPEAVTLEHVSKSVAFDRSSAPRDCRVSAWFEGPDDNPSDQSKRMSLLTEFSYDLEKSNAQTFNVETVYSAVVNMVRLDFFSNHGSSSLTCIYRFRVHGYEPSSSTNMMMQA